MAAEQQEGHLPEDGRRIEDNFDVLPTHLNDFELLVDHGADPEGLTRADTRELRDMTKPYVDRARIVKDLSQLQNAPHDRFVRLGQDNPGLRGTRDMITGTEVQINPRTTDVFDQDALRRSLGERVVEVLHRRVTVMVDLDLDKDDVEGFVASVERRLKKQGSKTEVNVVNGSWVDEGALRKMVEKEGIALEQGAWKTEVVGFTIVPRKIASKKDLQETEEEMLAEKEQDAQTNL